MKKAFAIFCAVMMGTLCCGCKDSAPKTETLAVFTKQTGFPAHIIPTKDGKYYTLLHDYDSEEYAVSVSENVKTMNTVHDLGEDSWTWHLAASEGGAIWCESNMTYVWKCYHASDKTIVEIDGDYQQSGFQNMKVGMHKNYAYYAHIDYEHESAEIIRYNPDTKEKAPIYTFPYSADISIQSLKVCGDYLTLAGCVDSEYPDAVVINLETEETSVLELGAQAGYIFDAAYDGENLVLYYETADTAEEQIALYEKESRTLKPIHKFDENHYAYQDTIDCRDGRVYWISHEYVEGNAAELFAMEIFDIKKNNKSTTPCAFDYTLTEDGLYYLCYVNDTSKVELKFESK